MFAIPTSGVSHVRWPAVPDATGATFLAMLRQFDESERLPMDELVALQFAALTGVLGHAGQTVPYYRDRPVYLETLGAGSLDADAWRRLPVLTRTDLQDAGTSAVSEAIPPDHTPADRFAHVRLHRTAGAHGRHPHHQHLLARPHASRACVAGSRQHLHAGLHPGRGQRPTPGRGLGLQRVGIVDRGRLPPRTLRHVGHQPRHRRAGPVAGGPPTELLAEPAVQPGRPGPPLS